MNLSQFIDAVRSAVDDSAQTKYPDEFIVQSADDQLRAIFREQVEGHKELHNFTFSVPKSAAVSIFEGAWEYRLPTWIRSVVHVHAHQDSGVSASEEFAPYRWAGRGDMLGPEVQRSNGMVPGWSWEGHHTLRLHRYPEAVNLTLRVAKYPPRLFKAEISTEHADPDKIYLPGSLVHGLTDAERGAYCNAEIQVVSTADPASTLYGEIRRVVDSNASTILAGSRQHELMLDGPLALEAGDMIETMMPIDLGHVRYLVLRTLNALFVRRSNLPGQRAIRKELDEERVAFARFATPPRDTRIRFYTRTSITQRSRSDPDRLPGAFLPG